MTDPPDFGSDYLLISISILTSHLTTSISHLISFNNHKAWDEYLYIDTQTSTLKSISIKISTPLTHPVQLYFLFQKPPAPSPNSSMMLPLLPFISATSIVPLKLGCFLKLQKPLRNAVRLLQEYTVLKKTARTILLSQGIPLLRFQRL